MGANCKPCGCIKQEKDLEQEFNLEDRIGKEKNVDVQYRANLLQEQPKEVNQANGSADAKI